MDAGAGGGVLNEIILAHLAEFAATVEAERTRLCGEAHAGRRAESSHEYRRAGSRSIEILVPELNQVYAFRFGRVRRADGSGEHDLTYLLDRYRETGTTQALIADRIRAGIKIKQMRRADAKLRGAVSKGVSPAQVSRQWRAICTAELKEINKRDLSGYRFVELKIDASETAGWFTISAIGTTVSGESLILGARVAGKESKRTVGALLRALVRRGVPTDGSFLITADGGAGIAAAIADVFPDNPAQWCVVHRLRNILEKITGRNAGTVREWVARRLKLAWSYTSQRKAIAAQEAVAADLAKKYRAAAKAIRKTLHETTTWQALGIPGELRALVSNTNKIENAFGQMDDLAANVDRWTGPGMVIRWNAAGLAEAERASERTEAHAFLPEMCRILTERAERLAAGKIEQPPSEETAPAAVRAYRRPVRCGITAPKGRPTPRQATRRRHATRPEPRPARQQSRPNTRTPQRPAHRRATVAPTTYGRRTVRRQLRRQHAPSGRGEPPATGPPARPPPPGHGPAG